MTMGSTSAFAPLALFAYKRPDHLRRTLASLRANPEAAQTTLHVFCDGPRDERDRAGVEEVREIVAAIDGFGDINVAARDHNAGLSRSIIEGVTAMLREHGRVIVVEDDLVVAPTFLRYMNDALTLYALDQQVASIHGYIYPLQARLPETFFLKGADCWGWATWDRAWRLFEPDGAKLLDQLLERRMGHAFDLDGSFPYTRMLEDQIAGRNDSWAIRWHASAYLAGALTLYPGRSLVENIGHDASGTHSARTERFSVRLDDQPIEVRRIPLIESAQARAAIRKFLQPEPAGTSPWRRVVRRIREATPWLR